MKLRRLGNTDVFVTPIGLGCRTIHKVGLANAVKLINYAVSLGINFVDTANIYGDGESERIVGQALSGIRDKVILATKGGIIKTSEGLYTQDLRPMSVKKAVKESLKRLNSDYIDLYQLHYSDPATPISDTVKGLKEYLETGEIRYIGFSNFSLRELKIASGIYTVPSIQIPYNILQQKTYHEIKEFCERKDIAILVYTPLLTGLLTDKIMEKDYLNKIKIHHISPHIVMECKKIVNKISSVAREVDRSVSQVVLNWITNSPGVTSVLVGMNKIEHIEENIESIDWRIPTDVKQKLDRIIDNAKVRLDDEYFVQEVKDIVHSYNDEKVVIISMGMKIVVPKHIKIGDKIMISWNGEYKGTVN